MNDIQEKYILNEDVSNVYNTVQKYSENHENSTKCIEKPKSKLLSSHWYKIWYKSDLGVRVLKMISILCVIIFKPKSFAIYIIHIKLLIIVLEYIIDGQISNISAVSDNFKDVQVKIPFHKCV